MSTRTVRLDADAERALADVTRVTGMNVAEALRHGLILLQGEVKARAGTRPFDVYQTLDLGEGGYAHAPASRAKEVLDEVLRKKVRG